jgi:lipoprotein-anchoring transpeptidase ErfK/SrfK
MIGARVRVVARPVRWLAVAAAALVLAAACTGSSGDRGTFGGGGTEVSGSTGRASGAAGVTVAFQPGANAKNVAPGSPVVVKATGGTLGTVRLTGAGGQVSGNLDGSKTTWTSTGKLAYSTTYQVTASATDQAGRTTTASSGFTTVTAQAEVFPAVAPLRGTVMGVGLPLRVYFDAPIQDRKAATDHMIVRTSVPTEGAWHWMSDREVHWRPRVYWTAHTQISLDISLFGVNLGGGVWGGQNADRHLDFSVGDSHVSIADIRTHQLKVYANGKLVKTFPASMGKEVPGRYTKGGPHVVIEKDRVKKMDSRTFGLALDAGGYTAKVEWATRISNNGEFVHSAPWSVAQQGHENVSHGCVNLSPANAQWFFNFSRIGDVVDVVGSRVMLSAKDGDIYDWAFSWSRWVQG